MLQQRQRTMLWLVLSTVLLGSPSDAFTPRQRSSRRRTSPTVANDSGVAPTVTRLNFRHGGEDHHHGVVDAKLPLSAVASVLPPLLDSGLLEGDAPATSAAVNPLVEAEALNDFSHVALDFCSFLGTSGPGNLAMRGAAVVGRLAAMGADWLPDHKMLPEELAFQVGMLGLACVGLYKAAAPLALASTLSPTNLTLRDGKAYRSLFQPAGLSWSQYKALTAVRALDWTTVEAGNIITSDEMAGGNDQHDVYWLYSGDVTIQSQGQLVSNVTRSVAGKPLSKWKQDVGKGLLGESRLLDWIQATERRSGSKAAGSSKSKSIHPPSSSSSTASSSSPPQQLRTTVKAGPGGATLLRIHTAKLSQLLATDQDLVHTLRSLVFLAMQHKLEAAHKELSSNNNNHAPTTN